MSHVHQIPSPADHPPRNSAPQPPPPPPSIKRAPPRSSVPNDRSRQAQMRNSELLQQSDARASHTYHRAALGSIPSIGDFLFLAIGTYMCDLRDLCLPSYCSFFFVMLINVSFIFKAM
ncbi:hypothetical protein V8C26DRAFT_159606 [Trichoderma gracile]